MGITILGGINQGLIWALLAIGVFVTFRILDFADLTVEGSFALGGLIAALFINNLSLNPFLATFVAMLAGGVAGLVTGLLNVKLKIPPILSGILTMTALVSINLLVTGGTPSIPVLYAPTVYNWIFPEGMKIFNISANYFSELIMGIIFVAAVVAILYWFFGTEVGMSIRATGANEKMSRAQGINTDLNKIYALVISNALVGLSGALFAQQQAGATNTMGQGAIVIGLAAVVIGETLIPAKEHFWLKLASVAIGSIIYRIITSIIFYLGLSTNYIQLISALVVAIALSVPTVKTAISRYIKRRKNDATPPDGGATQGLPTAQAEEASPASAGTEEEQNA